MIAVTSLSMNHATILSLVTTMAISISAIIGASSFVLNTAHAASFCKTIDNNIVCNTSPDEVCLHHGPKQVECTTRNSDDIIFK